MKTLNYALFLTGLATVSGSAHAEEAASPHRLSATVGLSSNYIFRGISQTGGDPAVQGSLDYSHRSGVYLGACGSNVGWIENYQGYNSGNVEFDLYGGFRGDLGTSGFTYDLGAIRYLYPGRKPAATTGADTTEVYAALGWKWFTAKYAYSVSDNVIGFRNAEGTGYLDLSASVPIGETGFTAGAHWGRFEFENNGAQDYDDWKLSLSYDLGKLGQLGSGVTVGVMYTDSNADRAVWTDGNGEFLGKAATTVWIARTF